MNPLDDAIQQLDELIAKLTAADPTPLPKSGDQHTGTSVTDSRAAPQVEASEPSTTADTDVRSAETSTQKPKAKKEKQPAVKVPVAAVPDSGASLFARAQLQVVRVLTVDDIASDKLYKTSIDIGGGQTRQVVAGLKQHVERESLQGSLAVAILNLKPAKLAGKVSEAMLLAADAPLEYGGELVKILVPPEVSEVGDAVFLEGNSPAAEYPKVLKSGLWKDIVAGLSVQSGKATFEGQALVTSKGPVTLPAEIPDGAGIH